ncbi:MAG: phage major capsid protein [Clostridia bacterium]|nr:phage major capsid protein [Clostridia bacterium]
MLAQLRLRRTLREKEELLNQKRSKMEEIKVRATELEKAIEEAETEEDQHTIDEALDALPSNEEIEHLQSDIDSLSGEVDELTRQIAELDEKPEQGRRGGTRGMEHSDIVTRERVRELVRTGEYYERSDVKDFYSKIGSIRAVSGGELTIPQVIVTRIEDLIGDYATVFPLCEMIPVGGTARILVDTDDTAASWMEDMESTPDPSDVGKLGNIDLDGYLLGKIVRVPNYLLQDSMVNLDDYIVKKIARAMAIALDTGVLNGKGTKSMTGIIPSLEAARKKTVLALSNTFLADLVSTIALIDDGNNNAGTITAVMRRTDYYNYIFPKSIQSNSAGQLVASIPAQGSRDLLGIPVAFNNEIEAGNVLFGDFYRYKIAQRQGMTLAASDQPLFEKNMTAYRGIGRYDGKPSLASAFALATINESTTDTQTASTPSEGS